MCVVDIYVDNSNLHEDSSRRYNSLTLQLTGHIERRDCVNIDGGCIQGRIVKARKENWICYGSARGVARVFGTPPKKLCNSQKFAKSLKLFTKSGYLKTN